MDNCQTSADTTLNFAEYIEIALFGRILEKITLEEAFYILNEKNYKKTYLEFQEGFNKIKKEDLIVDGAFKDILKEISLTDKYIKFSKTILIEQKKSYEKEKKSISYKIRNDVIGKTIFEKSYKKILEKYS